MLASDLLGRRVVDSEGREIGVLRDVRVDSHLPQEELRARWLVVGGHELAHRFGYVDGRTRGPALLMLLLRRGRRDQAVAVPVESVASWGPTVVRLASTAERVARPVDEAMKEW